VRNEEVGLLHTAKDRNILHTIKKWKGIRIGHCLQKPIFEGKTEGRIEPREDKKRRCKQLLDDPKRRKGYWKLKEEAQDHILRRTRIGRGCGSVVRLQNEK
jgi:hypothetical protein